MKKKRNNTFWTSIILGTIATYLGTSIVVGGFNNAIQIISLSIICSSGIGLVFWIGIIMGAAFLIRIIFRILGMTDLNIDFFDDGMDLSPTEGQLKDDGKWRMAVVTYILQWSALK